MDDREVVERQLGRTPRAFERVVITAGTAVNQPGMTDMVKVAIA